METQNTGNSKRYLIIAGVIALACCCLTVASAGAAGVFFYLKPASSGTGDSNLPSPKLEALVNADEMNQLSAPYIIDWTVVAESPGEHRICREFSGISDSATPNVGMNCIYNATAGATLDNVIASFIESGQIFEDQQPVSSTLSMPYEHSLYVGTHPNGHLVVDLFVMNNGRVYWSSVTMMRSPGVTPQDFYQEYYTGIVDSFLYEIIKINIARNE